MSSDPVSDQSELRAALRARRSNLDEETRYLAAAGVAERLQNWNVYRNAKRIAAYHAVGGELDPMPAIEAALKNDKQIFLPVLEGSPPRRLRFAAWKPGAPMRNNRFGIPEPQDTEYVDGDGLDLVLAPLVACDRLGHRVGMGGGFYDTTFGYRLKRPHAAPLLAGLAYGFQLQEAVRPNPWDVPLDHVVTEEEIINCRQEREAKQ